MKYFDNGRVKSFTKLKLKMVAGDPASDFSNKLFDAIA